MAVGWIRKGKVQQIQEFMGECSTKVAIAADPLDLV
jgi:hypothetical protein